MRCNSLEDHSYTFNIGLPPPYKGAFEGQSCKKNVPNRIHVDWLTSLEEIMISFSIFISPNNSYGFRLGPAVNIIQRIFSRIYCFYLLYLLLINHLIHYKVLSRGFYIHIKP